MIELSRIRTDGGTQSRAAIREETVAEYLEAMENPETVFPPVTLYFDGTDYWLADGFHRLAAWKRIGRVAVPAHLREGDRRRAILHSVAANAAHGLPRSNNDKRRAVMTLLEDDEWSAWTDTEIARQCGVSQPFVSSLRRGLSQNGFEIPAQRTVKRGDTTYQQDTSKIGKRRAEEAANPEPASAPRAAPAPPLAHGETPLSAPGTAPEPVAAPEVAPEPEPAPDPYEYSKLTLDALLETANGLRADWEEMRSRVENQRERIADLKAQVAQLTESSDMGRTVGNLQRRLAQSEGRSKEHQAKAARLHRQVNAQKAEIARLRKELEAQEIPL